MRAQPITVARNFPSETGHSQHSLAKLGLHPYWQGASGLWSHPSLLALDPFVIAAPDAALSQANETQAAAVATIPDILSASELVAPESIFLSVGPEDLGSQIFEQNISPSSILSAQSLGLATTNFVILSNDIIVDGLIGGARWSSEVITFSFPDTQEDYSWPNYPDTEIPNPYYYVNDDPSWDLSDPAHMQQVSTIQMGAIRQMLLGPGAGGSYWPYGSVASFTNLDFVDAGFDDADLRFATTEKQRNGPGENDWEVTCSPLSYRG